MTRLRQVAFTHALLRRKFVHRREKTFLKIGRWKVPRKTGRDSFRADGGEFW